MCVYDKICVTVTGAGAYTADTANTVLLLTQAQPLMRYAVPLFGRSVNISEPILKQLRLVLSAGSDHDTAKIVLSVYPAMLFSTQYGKV